jgi:hypothetical protein
MIYFSKLNINCFSSLCWWFKYVSSYHLYWRIPPFGIRYYLYAQLIRSLMLLRQNYPLLHKKLTFNCVLYNCDFYIQIVLDTLEFYLKLNSISISTFVIYFAGYKYVRPDVTFYYLLLTIIYFFIILHQPGQNETWIRFCYLEFPYKRWFQRTERKKVLYLILKQMLWKSEVVQLLSYFG